MTAIGIDTGSTSTDAVVCDLETKTILASAKSVTTHAALEQGIRESLRQLPRGLVEGAAYLSLSTTLATNACVENKGENVCLLFIGASRKAVEWTFASYGFESMDFMRFIAGDPAKGEPPDWQALDALLPELARRYGGVAVAQMSARENDGAYEREAAARIRAYCGLPVTCSYEIFRELNVIKRGAGALLNARMDPIIRDFFRAIHRVLDEDGIALPVFILRSDGSLVSEDYTLRCPVETLVCGPTASVQGAAALFPEERDAVVVDMGGTTSDLAILRHGAPLIDAEGIRLAGWQTFVRGVSIDTLGLGGDSRVLYRHGELSLDSRRALPISILAARRPEVLTELQDILDRRHIGTVPVFEHFLSVRPLPEGDGRFTAADRAAVAALSGGPLSVLQLAAALGTDEYLLRPDRLEQQGVILRSGFTPTDAILLKGDGGNAAAGAYGALLRTPAARRGAELALAYLSAATGRSGGEILEEVYRLVQEKLYCRLVELLWRDTYGRRRAQVPRDLGRLARDAFAAETSDAPAPRFFRNTFSTDAALLGVGAPTHIFLPGVAAALRTRCRTSPHSGVSNALGAVLGQVCVYDTVHIRPGAFSAAPGEKDPEFYVYAAAPEPFDDLDAAIARAGELAEGNARRRALACGAVEVTELTRSVRRLQGTTRAGPVPLGAEVTACARGRLV